MLIQSALHSALALLHAAGNHSATHPGSFGNGTDLRGTRAVHRLVAALPIQ